MTPEQVVQKLRAVRYTKPPTLSDIAHAAGISHMAAYRAVTTGRLSEAHRQAFERALRQFTIPSVSETR